MSILYPLLSEPTPKPPFEVKVIESKVQNDELKQEIIKLKNQLEEAKMLISVNESDTLKN